MPLSYSSGTATDKSKSRRTPGMLYDLVPLASSRCGGSLMRKPGECFRWVDRDLCIVSDNF